AYAPSNVKHMTRGNGWLFVSTETSVTALNEVTGEYIGWTLDFLGGVMKTFAAHNGILYLGGSFTSVEGVARSRFAAVDITTGSITPLQVNSNNTIRSMAADQDGLIIGGSFTTLSGFFIEHMAKLDYTTGLPLDWTV